MVDRHCKLKGRGAQEVAGLYSGLHCDAVRGVKAHALAARAAGRQGEVYSAKFERLLGFYSSGFEFENRHVGIVLSKNNALPQHGKSLLPPLC